MLLGFVGLVCGGLRVGLGGHMVLVLVSRFVVLL